MWNEVVQKNDSGGTVSVCEMENTFSRENDSVRGKVLPHIGGHGGLVVGLHHGDDPRSRCDQRVLSVHVPRRQLCASLGARSDAVTVSCSRRVLESTGHTRSRTLERPKTSFPKSSQSFWDSNFTRASKP